MPAINLQRVTETIIADGSIEGVKFATGAIDLASDKVGGELPEAKLADNAVTENKIAALAIATAKLQDNVVTLAKSDRALKVHHLLTDDTPSPVTGVTETEIKTLRFSKASNTNDGFVPNKLAIQVELKTNNATYQATLKVYVDNVLKITLNSVSTTYELLSGNEDISALANGTHDISVRLLSANASGITTNQLFTAFLEK